MDIQLYCAMQSDEDEENASSSEDDWEVWADPREQMRRKQERKKVVDPAARAVSAAAEFRAAKEEAMKAKEKGDKQRQMAAGKVIRELKEEMARLGLEEEVLYREPATDDVGALAGETDGREDGETAVSEGGGFGSSLGGLLTGEESDEDEAENNSEPLGMFMAENDERQEMGGAELGGDCDSKRDGDAGSRLADAESRETKAAGETTKAGAEDEQPEEEGMGSMFDEDAVSEELPASVLAVKRKEKRVVEMWGAGSQGGGGKHGPAAGKKGKGAGAPSQEEVLRMPKTVLQQLCQKNGWLSPRYEKLPLLETGAWGQYRYSVMIVRPAGGRRKGRVLTGPTTYQLPEDEDGWESVSDAQNAVATRALYSLIENQPLYRTLPSPYREMWLRWDDQGVEKLKEETAEEQARRSAFINTLISTGTSAAKGKIEEPRIKEGEEKNRVLSMDTKTKAEEWEAMAASMEVDKRKSEMEAERLKAQSRRLKEKRRLVLNSVKYQAMHEVRLSLPILAVKDEMLHALHEWGVVVISGETGSGKTTQVPQYILDDMLEREEGAICNIICTQPRRIAAVSVAERVAEERCEHSPGSPEATVGYHVRLDAARSASTRLLFCTTGILLRRFASDPDLAEVTHVIVDEVHERTIQGDFLLVILKDLLEKRKKSPNLPKLRLLLMSATVDPSLFSQYFGGCPIISASGRTFGVETHFLEDVYETLEYRLTSSSDAALHGQYDMNRKKTAKNLVASSRGRQDLVRSGWGDDASLDEAMVNSNYDEKRYVNYSERTHKNLALVDEEKIDYDLLEELIIHIDTNYEPGAILVFLPGVAEIQALLDRLTVSPRFGGLRSSWLLPLHSSVSPADQRRVFLRPPENIRKIVVATNIAETSITIDDIAYVVDSGKHKENRYNPRKGMTCLVEAWISRANAKQRQGRAGRVREGHCFALYTKHRHSVLMRMYQLPEMLRVSLVELCLQIMVLNLAPVSSFLAKTIHWPIVAMLIFGVRGIRKAAMEASDL
ncbi:hypothetical protein CBR_g34283 [Chara braunii]|uniref:RNA helicase n=1 Tax=Chara braunii TaxID=69332 RepID=A0A388JYM1_CHABU|nr:hypothetical protein CBR_g34283 [Chara braunii]|eukprot:GBG62911.1 hypothetical protein CBR_g34283 [Chara braunii]